MNAMLVLMFSCIALGLLADRWRERVYGIVALLGVTVTAVYFFLPRYM
jgi:hypothetical protein